LLCVVYIAIYVFLAGLETLTFSWSDYFQSGCHTIWQNIV